MREAMRVSTVCAMIGLGLVAMVVPAQVIFRLPLVPNWPYVGLVCMGVSAVAGGISLALTRRHLPPPSPITVGFLLRVFPVWVSAFALFESFVLFTTEEYPSLEFREGVVVEKYRSSNHGYLSVRVEVPGRGGLKVEGVSPGSWEQVSVGSTVSKRCGVTDVTLKSP